MMPILGLTRQCLGTVVMTLKPIFLSVGFLIESIALAPPPKGPIAVVYGHNTSNATELLHYNYIIIIIILQLPLKINSVEGSNSSIWFSSVIMAASSLACQPLSKN